MKPLAPVRLLVADSFGQHAFQGRLRRAAVVLADPAGELKDFGCDERLRANDFEDGLKGRVLRFLSQASYAPEHLARAERDLHSAAEVNFVRELGRNIVIELLAECDFKGNAGNHACRGRYALAASLLGWQFADKGPGDLRHFAGVVMDIKPVPLHRRPALPAPSRITYSSTA